MYQIGPDATSRNVTIVYNPLTKHLENTTQTESNLHTGTFLEEDTAYPGLVFNTACIVGPEGIVLRYRKANNWIPIETFASPHLVEGYNEELFPVTETPLGVLGCLTSVRRCAGPRC